METDKQIANASLPEETATLTVGSAQLSCLHNRYELRRQLSFKPGKQTFLAWDAQNNDLVVTKVLLFGNDLQWSDLKLFEREAQILQALDHPSIPKYLDYFELDEASIQGFVLVQDYIAAPTLEQLMQQGRRFSEADLVELSNQLLQLLDYLHRQVPVVIHRDIKPSNILLAPQLCGDQEQSSSALGTIYLIDFGSVQASASGTPGTITIVGSHGYIPLEQFGGQAVPASDLYSLGMTMLYLASGTHPSEMPLAKNGRVQVQLPQLSFRYRKWLDKMTHPYLEQRYESAQVARLACLDQAQLRSSTSPQVTEPKVGGHFSLIEQGERLIVEIPRHKIESSAAEGCMTALVFIISFFIFASALPTIAVVVSVLTGKSAFILGWFFLPILMPFLMSLIAKILSELKKDRLNYPKFRSYLLLDHEEVCLFQNKGDLLYGNALERNSINEVKMIIYRPSYGLSKCLDLNGHRLRNIEGSTEGELCLYAGNTQYPIRGLKSDEFWELGQIISDFLGVELQVVYPTPQIPEEPSCGGGC